MGFIGSSCTGFFSNSWAPWAARDPNKLIPKVTPGNVDQLIAMAENDPDLSLALLKAIEKAMRNASPEDRAKLQNAALKTGTNSSGLGQAIMGAAGNLSSGGFDSDEEIISTARDAIMGMENLVDTAHTLVSILPSNTSGQEWDDFVAASEPDDLAIAAIVIIMGEAKSQNPNLTEEEFQNYVDDLQNDPNPPENLALAMSLAAAASTGLNSTLNDMLSGLNMI